MLYSITNPELLTITTQSGKHASFGGNQIWYAAEWGKRAGCGPTCAANVLSYLAFTKPELRGLYGYDTLSQESFTKHMEELFAFITPGNMGVNRAEMFSEGAVSFAKSRGITLRPHVFNVMGNLSLSRPDVSQFTAFVMAGLEANCPLGFLNLTRGRVKTLQSWHWITITKAELGHNSLTAEASDEGRCISFDLRLWYLSTRMSGGLVYFT